MRPVAVSSAIVAALGLGASVAHAAKCSDGGLVFVGKTSDLSVSVWASKTESGSFALEAPGNTVVDTWDKQRRGIHISLSPVVSPGNGSPHSLIDTGNNCTLANNVNQKGGITFPPHIQLPPKLPPLLRPPNSRPSLPGTMPTRPQMPGHPTGMMPTMPGGVAPPIATLPPSGMMPTVPGGVAPPIGTLPPTGMTPTVPGGVAPPIGTLPPTGMMPTVPGGVTPPIGTLPPSGMMPTVPGGVTPPIGTLPPSGLTPPIGTLPPSGMMPTVPGGVTPPVGTLPPSGLTPSVPGQIGVMPTVPGGVTPPIATLPPSGLTPTVPGGVAPPIGTVPQPGATATVAAPGGLIPGSEGPLTEGRRFALSPDWNVWVDATRTGIKDRRFGLDTDGQSGHVTIGADWRLRESLVVGMMVLLEQNRVDGFGDDLSVRADGISIGPYFAYRFSPVWTIDGSLTAGQLENDERIAVLTGQYSSQRYAASLGATGDYAWGEARVYPRFTVSYTEFRNDEHSMSGKVAGAPVSVRMAQNNFNYGVTEASVELTRGYRAAGVVWYPFAELGLRYEFERPNDGRILTGNLTLEETSPWSGSVRAGVRTLLAPQMFMEASVGYLSLGQQDLDVVEGRLFLSFAF